MILLDEPGVLRVFHEEESRTQVHEWLNYNPEDRDSLILDLLDRIYQLLIEHPVEKVLVKTDRARGAFSLDVQTFIRDVQFPRLLADTTIRFVATVRSPDQMTAIGTDLWKVQLEQHSPLIMHDVESEVEGRDWLNRVEEMARQRDETD